MKMTELFPLKVNPFVFNFSSHLLFILINSAHLNKDVLDVVCIITGEKG